MKIDGVCHCGAVQYEAEIDPATVSICHCNDCQTISGAPFRGNVAARAENFRLTRGTPKPYVKTADSGNQRIQAFCGDCGTSLYSCDAGENAGVFMLRLGAVQQREQLRPVRRIWARSAMPWSQDISDLECHPCGMAMHKP